ncbi:MAG: lipid-A-disaccharide synthase [Planctomycetota bacterium]
MAEFRRRLLVLWLTAGAFLSFVPFLGNLALSFVLGGRFRRRIRTLLENPEAVPVDDPGDPGSPSGRVYVIAGEDSGDFHAASLIRSIRRRAPDVEVRGMGGPRMEEAGCDLDYDLVRMNVMGIGPVLRSLPIFMGLFRDLLRRLDTDPPDVLVPVDYPGFNLRAARLARRRGVRVVYYVLPQVWAWAPWRIRRIARSVDRVLLMLPFEKTLCADGDLPAAYIGHPVYEHLEAETPAAERTADDGPPRTIGILPGSRRAEVRSLLPCMLRAARELRERHPDLRFVLPSQRESLREEIEGIVASEGEGLGVEIVFGRTHEVMRDLDLAMVASGTATLELAYYRVPMAALYRLTRFGALVKRFLLITPWVVLVNIVAGRTVVPEIVHREGLAERTAEALRRWIEEPGELARARRDLEEVRSRLLISGTSDRAAGWVLRQLRKD